MDRVARTVGTAFGPSMDEVHLNSLGIDVGSSTSHLILSEIVLRRKGEVLGTRFEVIERNVLYKSDIWLTPYVDRQNLIDAEALRALIDEAFELAGIDEKDIDTGAVILTGSALLRENALPVVETLARDSGKFVCATAGHNYEAILAAHGGGAVDLSASVEGQVLSVDIGGGTTKLSIVESGTVVDTLAIAAGARLVAVDSEDRITRRENEVRLYSHANEGDLSIGSILTIKDRATLGNAIAEEIVRVLRLASEGKADSTLGRSWLSGRLPRVNNGTPIVISGGVSEFMSSGSSVSDVGDCGQFVAEYLLEHRDDLVGPILVPEGGIRATVVGAGQHTVQVSGNTIFITDETQLPLRNVPVAVVELPSGDVDESQFIEAVRKAVELRDLTEYAEPIAVFIEWSGPPSYANLNALASGLFATHSTSLRADQPLLAVLDADVARSVGRILDTELGLTSDCVVVDALSLSALDFIDIGEKSVATNTVPVVIKSLLLAST